MDAPSGTEQPNAAPTGSVRKKSGKGVLWALLAVVVAFLIGFGWQWYEAGTVRQQLSETQQELLVERLRVRLGQAALAAQAGNYESARQQMSEFFTQVSQSQAALPDSLGVIATDFLAMRDDVITGLSRSNPEYAGVLYGMLEGFRMDTPPATAPTGPAEPAAPESVAPESAAVDTGAGMGG